MWTLNVVSRVALLSALSLWTLAPQLSHAETEEAGPQELWYAQISLGYESLAHSSQQLLTETERYCQAPDSKGRATLEAAWTAAFESWQAVRFVDFGPIEQNNLAWQFQFWPDTKNLVGRKAGQLLNTENGEPTDLIAQNGVAAQGFPIAEYLLFDEKMNASEQSLPAQKACAVIKAVSARISSNADSLIEDWKEFQPHYLANETYRETTLKSMMHGLDILTERRLAAPMGLRGNGKRSIYQADAWRSGQSLAAIQASMTGLRDTFLPGLSLWLESEQQNDLARAITKQVDKVIARLDTLPPSMALMLSDERFSQLQGLYVDLSQLQQLVTVQAASSLGVIKGFNSSDGD